MSPGVVGIGLRNADPADASDQADASRRGFGHQQESSEPRDNYPENASERVGGENASARMWPDEAEAPTEGDEAPWRE